MANMSYCRFENTERDLRDCYHNMDNPDDLSDTEAEARESIIQLCLDIAEEYGDQDHRVY